jgi:hypothetical protein
MRKNGDSYHFRRSDLLIQKPRQILTPPSNAEDRYFAIPDSKDDHDISLERKRAKAGPQILSRGSAVGEPVQRVAALQDRLDISIGDLRHRLFRDPGLDLS